MSYSFSVVVSSKEEAKVRVGEELAAVIVAQPIHQKDAEQAQAATESIIALLADDSSRNITIAVNGWLGWEGDQSAPDCRITSASVNVTASLTAKTL